MAKLDWNEYIEKAVQVNAEGAVLVRNQGGLPLDKNSETAVLSAGGWAFWRGSGDICLAVRCLPGELR